jgi:hypothetical protein
MRRSIMRGRRCDASTCRVGWGRTMGQQNCVQNLVADALLGMAMMMQLFFNCSTVTEKKKGIDLKIQNGRCVTMVCK